MTAVDEFRRKVRDQNTHRVSAQAMGEAISELAERLDKLEAARTPAATESPPEPFRITEPGTYITRRHGAVTLTGPLRGTHPWEDQEGRFWSDVGLRMWRGNYDDHDSWDIIAGPLAEEPKQEMAGLTGWISRSVNDYGTEWLCLHAAEATAHLIAGPKGDVFRLDQLPASAIVKPEPKRETRKLWLLARENGYVSVYNSRNEADKAHMLNNPTVALVETEITFEHGQELS